MKNLSSIGNDARQHYEKILEDAYGFVFPFDFWVFWDFYRSLPPELNSSGL